MANPDLWNGELLKKPDGKKPAANRTEKAVRNSGLKRGRFKEVPDERRGYWHGVMTLKLRQQEQEEGFDGFYRCTSGQPECDSVIEGFDEARRFFVPAHVKPRAEFNHKGFRFNKPTLGPDDPDNIEPWCQPCNIREFWNRKAEAS